MKVPMMHIRVMCVTMFQPSMRMCMAVWFPRIPSLGMVMLMVSIVSMTVSMGKFVMDMRVFMAFAHM